MARTVTTNVEISGSLNASLSSAIRSAQSQLRSLKGATDQNSTAIQQMQVHANAMRTNLAGMVAEYANYEAAGQGSSAAAQQLAADIQNTASSLQQQQSQIDSAVSAATRLVSGYNQAGSASRTLSQTVSQQQSELNQLKQRYIDVATSQGRDSEEAQRLAGEIRSLSSELASNRGRLQEASAEADSFDASLEQAGSACGSAEGRVGSLQVALGNLASAGFQKACSAAKDFAKDVLQTGMNLENNMAEVSAIGGFDVGSEDYIKIQAEAKKMGQTTQFSSAQAAEAFKYMALAGWDADQSIKSLPAVLDLAAASGMELGQASDIVTDYMSAFSGSAVTASEMVDMMAFAQNNSNTTTNRLAESYKNCAANMNASGQSIQTTTAMLEALANQGTKGSEAGTQVAAMMRDVTQKMENGSIAIGDTAVSVMDAQGNFRDFVDILADVESATAGMGDAEKAAALSSTFTADSIKGINMLLGEQSEEYGNGIEAIRGYREELNNSTGAAAEAAARANDTLSGDLTKLGSAFSGVKEAIYDGLQEPLRSAVQWITANVLPVMQQAADAFVAFVPKIGEAFSKVGDFMSSLGISQGAGLAIAGIAGVGVAAYALPKVFNKLKSLNPFSFLGRSAQDGMSQATSAASSGKSKIAQIFEGLGNGIKSAFEGIGTGIQSVLTGFGTMGIGGAAAFAITIATITAALIALSACSGMVLPFLQGLSDIFLELVSGSLSAFGDFIIQIAGVIPILASALASLAPLVVAVGQAFGAAAPFVEAIGTAFATVVGAVGEAIAQIIAAFAPFAEVIGSVFSTVVQVVGEAVVAIINAIAPIMPAIADIAAALAPVIQSIVEAFVSMVEQISPIIDSLSGLLETFGQAVSTAMEGASGVIESVGNAIKSVLEGIADVFESIGNAALNAGKGFEAMANGISIITSLNLLDMGASLAAVATGAAAIGAEASTMAAAGDGFTQIAQALLLISTSITTAVGSFDQLQAVAGSMGSTVAELSGSVTGLDSVAMTVRTAMLTLGTSVSSSASQILAGMTAMGTALSGMTAHAAAFMAGAAIIVAALSNINTAASSSVGGFIAFSAAVSAMCTAVTAQMVAMQSSSMASLTAITSAMTSIIPAATVVVAAAYTSMRTKATSTMQAIVNATQSNFSRAKAIVSSTTAAMVSIFSAGMAAMANAVTTNLSGMAARISGYMNAAVASVRAGVAAMQAACSVTIQGPNIRLPHISVSGSFSINPPSAPSFSVSWYKQGGILDGAQIFGMAGGNLLGGGEAGKEAVLPLSELWTQMESILTTAMKEVARPQTALTDGGRMINAGETITNTTSSEQVVINFSPTINMTGAISGDSTSASSVKADLMQMLREARDEFEDFLDDYFERKECVNFG